VKIKLLIIYGYITPIVASFLLGAVPKFVFNLRFSNIHSFLAGNISLIFTLLAIIFALIIPFQAKIINEDNPHVLGVLKKDNVRIFFVYNVAAQVFIILLSIFISLLITMATNNSELLGYFAVSLLILSVLEAFASIWNCIWYNKIREKIIIEIEANKPMNRTENTSALN